MTTYPASIIVCTHNRAHLLSNVISELYAQNYPRDSFEIIVVDNCSTDDTPRVVQQAIPESAVSLRYVREDRPGVTVARNRGAQEARYPYLAYLDDDCTIGTDWLSWLMSGFDLDEQVFVVGGRVAVDFDDQKVPAWLGKKTERWLAEFNFPYSQAHLLDNPVYVCEGNMAIKRQAWEAVGGFFGMDQLGNPHVAAQEIVYLLEQIKYQGGKVAFVPEAIANHHTTVPTWQQLLRRAYWHGVSASMLYYLLKRHSYMQMIGRAMLDSAAMFTFLFLSLLFLFALDKSTAVYHLLRASARFGRIMGELRFTGDWRLVQVWVSTHGQSFHPSSRKAQS